MNRNTKKGFTIVELIIVIAVIAVLAAVLIPTFSNLIGKAQEAKDTALVRNLNEALAMDTTTSKHLTMSDAVAAVRNNGIDISKIKATVPGNAILWDSVNDLFAYYKVDKEGNSGDKVYYIPEYSADAPADGRLFAVVSDSNAIATSKYGVYYTGSNVDSVTVNGVGFDAGSAQIGTVVYNGSTSGATVDIRTNGGALTIKNAGNDDINHHNSVMSVVIEEVKGSSYHEYGTVQGNIEVKKGHVVLEKGASVGTIVVNPTDNATVSVSTNGGSAGAVVKKEGVTATIDSTLPTTTITGDQEEEMKLFAGGIGTETSPYLIENESNWNNLVEATATDTDYSATSGKYFKVLNNIDLSKLNAERVNVAYFAGSIDFDGHTITGFTAENTKSDITYDTERYKGIFSNISGNVTIENLKFMTSTITSGVDTFALQVAVALDGESTDCVATFKNIVIMGNASGMTGNNNAFLLSYGYKAKSGKINVIDCVNHASIAGGGFKAAFIGNISYGKIDEVRFANVINYGTIISASNSASMMISNPMVPKGNCSIVVENCSNQGRIIGNTSSTLLMNYSEPGAETLLNGIHLSGKGEDEVKAMYNNIISGTKPARLKETASDVENRDGNFILNKTEGATKYVLIFSFSAGNRAGGNTGYSLTFSESTLPETFKVGNWLTKSEAEATGKQIVTHNEYGTTYYTCGDSYVFYEEGAKFASGVFVTFMAYSENDELQSIATYEYSKK